MMKKFNISYKTAGENIAKGQKTPAQVVNAWMNSQGHRENILNKLYRNRHRCCKICKRYFILDTNVYR